MSKLPVVVAVLLQVVIFSAFQFFDARMATAPTFKTVLRFGLNPAVIAAYGAASIGIWWSYRTVTQAAGGRYFTAWLAVGPVIAIARLLFAYLGSKQVPTPKEAIAIALGLIGAVIVAWPAGDK